MPTPALRDVPQNHTHQATALVESARHIAPTHQSGRGSLSSVSLTLQANGQKVTYQSLRPDTVIAGREIVFDLPTAAWIDATAMGNYPITLKAIQLSMGASTTGKQYTMLINAETVYNVLPVTGMPTVLDEASCLSVTAANGVISFSKAVDSASLWSVDGKLIARCGQATSMSANVHGVCVLEANVAGKRITRKVVLK